MQSGHCGSAVPHRRPGGTPAPTVDVLGLTHCPCVHKGSDVQLGSTFHPLLFVFLNIHNQSYLHVPEPPQPRL